MSRRRAGGGDRRYIRPMTDFISQNEGAVRISVFLGVFALMALWEFSAPRRALVAPKPNRWGTNWGIVILDTLIVRILFPAAAVGAALDASAQGWGLFNWLDWPGWVEVVLAILAFDCLIYWQHVLSHRIPFLWRLHRVHHSDRDIDVSTAIRFHPGEIALSMALKIGAVYLLGPAAIAIILFEVILNGCALFNHSNIKLGTRVDAILRKVLVTPDMHRVHHSVIPRETDANFGFNVPWWDRLFGTYIDQPEKGHEGMTIGLHEFQDARPSRFAWSLLLPFRGRNG